MWFNGVYWFKLVIRAYQRCRLVRHRVTVFVGGRQDVDLGLGRVLMGLSRGHGVYSDPIECSGPIGGAVFSMRGFFMC